jgi:hypothetical protein
MTGLSKPARELVSAGGRAPDRESLHPDRERTHRHRQISTNNGTHMPPNRGPNRSAGHDPATLLTEHVPSERLADERYADQLVERIGWALVDAERDEQAIQA